MLLTNEPYCKVLPQMLQIAKSGKDYKEQYT